MRRLGTAFVVATLLGVGAAAAVDALRSGSGTAEPSRTTQATGARAAAAAELREAGIAGVLTYADRECRVHAVELPTLAPHPAPAERSCRFTVSRGNVLSFGRTVADPGLFLTAECHDGVVDLRADGSLLARYRGCAPTWRADGALTLVRDREVVLLDGPLAQPESIHARVLLSRTDLKRELRRAEWLAPSPGVEEIAWLGSRLVAVVQTSEPDPDVLALFARGRLVARPAVFESGLGDLRVSPRGGFVAARSVRGIAVVDRDGQGVPLPVVARAVAWSADERWLAAATASHVLFFRPGELVPRGIRVPIGARDLVWR
jgi:hypothetical protein